MPTAPPATTASGVEFKYLSGVFGTTAAPDVDDRTACSNTAGLFIESVNGSGQTIRQTITTIHTWTPWVSSAQTNCKMNLEVTTDGVLTGISTHSFFAVQQGNCGAGYVVNGSNCDLVDETLVELPPDGRCEILASVSGFTIDPQDSECSGLSGNGVGVTGGSITATREDGTVEKYTIIGDGSRTYEKSTPDAATGSTKVESITLLPDPSSTFNTIVGGTTINNFAGTGSSAGTTPTVPPIEFPDDYNREVTQGQILDALTNPMPDIFNVAPAGDSAISVAGSNATNFMGDLAASAQETNLGWTFLPTLPTVGSCAPITYGLPGSYTVDWDWCSILGDVRDVWGWAFSLLTVALFVALAALLTSISTAFPSGIVFTTFLWLVLPPQVPVGISAIIAADTAIGLYAWNVRNVGLASSAG